MLQKRTSILTLLRRIAWIKGKFFRAAKKLLAKKEVPSFPGYVDKSVLANDIGKFFIREIESIRSDIDKAADSRADMVLPEDPEVGPEEALLAFHPLSEDEVLKLVRQSAKKSCPLDPAPTSLVVSVSMSYFRSLPA